MIKRGKPHPECQTASPGRSGIGQVDDLPEPSAVTAMVKAGHRPALRNFLLFALVAGLPARAAEPFLVKDINPSGASLPASLQNVNGTIFFSADDGTSRTELWMSDGTVAGTVMVKDINPVPGTASDCCVAHAEIGCDDPTCEANVCAEATECCGGDSWEQHCADLASELCGTVCARGSSPDGLTDVNGVLFFSADDGIESANRELWMSDGTEGGTVMVKNIVFSGSSNPRLLMNGNGTLFFSADDGVNGLELWTSDGTQPGTMMVKDINPGAGGQSVFSKLTNVNGTLFFSAFDGVTGTELWKSDGTAPGTQMVTEIAAGPLSSSPEFLTDVNGTLFFSAFNGGDNFIALWKSDGTAAGTVLVKDINPGPPRGMDPRRLANVNGMLFFMAKDEVNGFELWRSDGTDAGTFMVKDISPGAGSSTPGQLTNVNGILFFSANGGGNNAELWKSDGTEAGTLMVRDINPAGGSFPRSLVNVNGTLFFSADDGTNGNELWMSDGTQAGTVLVADINPGLGRSDPGGLTNVNGTLFFSADDGTNGFELWALLVACDTDCDDGDICTLDQCIAGAICSNTPVIFGDVDRNGTVDIFDLFCILNGFEGNFGVCSSSDLDIEPCGGDGDIDLFDLFAVLNAFSGVSACDCPLGP